MLALSGIKTITTAGTALPLGSQPVAGPLMVKALTTNTGLTYIGNDGSGDVSAANGFPLSAGDVIIFNHVSSLNVVMADAAVDGEGVAWLVLNA
jgi:hypothetical protein